MPSKKDGDDTDGRAASRKRPDTRSPRNNSFVQFSLDRSELELIKTTKFSAEEALNYLESRLSDGYKLSLRFEEGNDCFAAWLIAPDDDKLNAGLILGARGSSTLKALRQLVYLDTVRFEDAWPRGTSWHEPIDD